ncbi:MAG TPA: galactokinase family protein [Longimicrobiales bacterium]|nr:galactokinase family protein [Longimicrobiales bacterium]
MTAGGPAARRDSPLASAAGAFEDRYGRAPEAVARAPGRVNLIGEHVDYHGLPVVPFAIGRAVEVIFARAPEGTDRGRVRIASEAAHRHAVSTGLPADPSDAPAEAFVLGGEIGPLGAGDWRNYARAAARELGGPEPEGPACTRGFDALVVSDLPMGAGLGSSSALVVGVGLALAHANGMEVDPLAFAERMARAERFVGTHGGGMDQAACLLSRADHVSLLGFDPLSVEHLVFPADLSVLVVDSGEAADKSGSLRGAYNERRASGAAASRAVSERLGRRGASFRDLLREFPESRLLSTAEAVLDRTPRSRFRHVVTEAGRVSRARAALESGDDARLGRILTASHESLRDDYGVSTSALDAIVESALEAGALGARLTGAGFGGSAIALVRRRAERGVREKLEHALPGGQRPDGRGRVTAVRPAAGASVAEWCFPFGSR